MLKIKRPSCGFFITLAALICSAVALFLYISTYKVGEYTVNRWALTCSIISIWFLVLLCGHMLIKGERPSWSGIILAVTAFMLIFGMTKFIQPCITPIGFVFGSGDLNMGDTALNKIVAYRSIITAIFYLVSAIFVIIVAFLPIGRKGSVKTEVKA